MTTTLAPVDRDRVVATLTAAFIADPVLRWLFPSTSTYLAGFSDLVVLASAPGLRREGVDHTPGHEGAAVWVPPGEAMDDEALGAALLGRVEGHRQEHVLAFLEQMGEHHPTEPHWYLPLIGVDPIHQGGGHGSRLLVTGLARANRDRLPAYLEASTERNRALYERFGFVVAGEIQAADSPPMWPMRYEPR